MNETFIFYNEKEAMDKLNCLIIIGHTNAFVEYRPDTMWCGYYLKPCWMVKLK